MAVNALANPAVLGVIAHSRDINRRKANERILALHHARFRTVADLSAGAVHEYLINAQGHTSSNGPSAPNACTAAAKKSTAAAAGRASCRAMMGGAEPRPHPTLPRGRDHRVHGADPPPRRAVRWIEVKNRPIADPATGKFTRLVGVAVDVTERKQAADALRESEFRYRTVAELTSGFVYEATVDEHGEAQIVWASPGWDKFFGGTFEELNRIGWREFFLPATTPARCGGASACARGERTEMEMRAEDAAAARRAGCTSPTSRSSRRRQRHALHRRGARHHRPQDQ